MSAVLRILSTETSIYESTNSFIVDTINSTVPNKNPQVYRDHFSTDELSHSEAVLVGRALSKVPELKKYGKNITIFRLFDGHTCNTKDKPKGGRVK